MQKNDLIVMNLIRRAIDYGSRTPSSRFDNGSPTYYLDPKSLGLPIEYSDFNLTTDMFELLIFYNDNKKWFNKLSYQLLTESEIEILSNMPEGVKKGIDILINCY